MADLINNEINVPKRGEYIAIGILIMPNYYSLKKYMSKSRMDGTLGKPSMVIKTQDYKFYLRTLTIHTNITSRLSPTEIGRKGTSIARKQGRI